MPYVDFMLMNNNREFLGFTSKNLIDLLPDIFDNKGREAEVEQDEDEAEASETIIDVDELEKQLNIVRDRRRRREELKEEDY